MYNEIPAELETAMGDEIWEEEKREKRAERGQVSNTGIAMTNEDSSAEEHGTEIIQQQEVQSKVVRNSVET